MGNGCTGVPSLHPGKSKEIILYGDVVTIWIVVLMTTMKKWHTILTVWVLLDSYYPVVRRVAIGAVVPANAFTVFNR